MGEVEEWTEEACFRAILERYLIITGKHMWASDITYIATEEGWLFLSVFLDIFIRKIVGFSLDDDMEANFVTRALEMALGSQSVNEGELISHSDRGSQYASDHHRKKLALAGIISSMSRKGNCYDNAYVESWFSSLKKEWIYKNAYSSESELRALVFEYIEAWYNKKRKHSSLGYLSPVQYKFNNMSL